MNTITNPCPANREVDATPHASALVEGHRDFGYSLETALADIVDNAISAGAGKVEVIAEITEEEPWIALADDGSGMTEAELVEAMRLGSKNPTEKRAPEDLGRFGLGLKSASFSQCRRLTVLTRRDGITACARWDLDRIAKRNDWALELIDNADDVVGHDLLHDTGTVVVWQKLDRLAGGGGGPRAEREKHMTAEIARAECHLRLVFHRFLGGSKPRLRILLNDRQLQPIDPMASSHSSTQNDPEETLRLDRCDVRIRCRTLPHHKRMTPEEWEEVGGPEGHLKSQGLYIYRGKRLIIAGGWLGLARQTELTKLCRVAVDIPNTMDAEWKIDVKKASAQLPPVVRERLKKVVERFVGTSKRTYKGKGRTLVDETRHPIWNRIHKDGQIVFRPNLQHPAFLAYANQLPAHLRGGFERCFRIVGSGLPIESLHAELAGNAEAVVADSVDEGDLEQMVRAMTDTLVASGVEFERLPEIMKSYPFLGENWKSVARILDGIREEGQREQ